MWTFFFLSFLCMYGNVLYVCVVCMFLCVQKYVCPSRGHRKTSVSLLYPSLPNFFLRQGLSLNLKLTLHSKYPLGWLPSNHHGPSYLMHQSDGWPVPEETLSFYMGYGNVNSSFYDTLTSILTSSDIFSVGDEFLILLEFLKWIVDI